MASNWQQTYEELKKKKKKIDQASNTSEINKINKNYQSNINNYSVNNYTTPKTTLGQNNINSTQNIANKILFPDSNFSVSNILQNANTRVEEKSKKLGVPTPMETLEKAKEEKKKSVFSQTTDDDEETYKKYLDVAKKDYSGLSIEEAKAEQEKIKKLMKKQQESGDYYKNNRDWWNKDDGILKNLGNVIYKSVMEKDSKDFTDEYNELTARYDALNDMIMNKNIENKTYNDGFTGFTEKSADVITGNAFTGFKGIETTVKKILGEEITEEDIAPTYMEKLSSKAMEDSKGIEKVALDVQGSIGRMLPQMMTPGGKVGQKIATGLGFANYGGGAYNEAIQEGYTDEQATKYGLTIGTLEMAMTKLLGTFGNVYGSTKIGNASQKIVDKVIPNVIKNEGVRYVLSQALSEGGEEFIQEYAESIAKDVLLDEKGFLKSTWENISDPDKFSDALYSAMIGSITGGALAGKNPNVETAIDNTKNQNVNVETEEQIKGNTNNKVETEKKEENNTQTNTKEETQEQVNTQVSEQDLVNIDNQLLELETQLMKTTDDVQYEKIAEQIRVLEEQGNAIEQQLQQQEQGLPVYKVASTKQDTDIAPVQMANVEQTKQPTTQETQTNLTTEADSNTPKPVKSQSVEQIAPKTKVNVANDTPNVAVEERQVVNNELAEDLQEQSVMTEEEYLASKGYSFMGYSEAGLHNSSQHVSKRGKKESVNYVRDKAIEYDKVREELRKEYREKLESGEIRKPTLIEQSLKVAQGMDERSDVQAARRTLAKRGIDWKTGEKIQNSAETLQTAERTTPTQEELDNLENTRKNKSGSEYASNYYALEKKYGKANLIKGLNSYSSTGKAVVEEIAPLTQELSDLKNELKDTIKTTKNELKSLTKEINNVKESVSEVSDEFKALTETDLPKIEQQASENLRTATDDMAPIIENTTPEYEFENDNEGSRTIVESPLSDRTIEEVGSRKVKAYQYEHPEVRPYFQREAQNMLNDLENSVKGTRIPIYDETGSMTYAGTTRQTTEDIASLLDSQYGYTYADIEKGLKAIIEDNGKENIAIAKRIEFSLDDRLRNGYTAIDGTQIPPNQEYINLLEEKEYNDFYNSIPVEDIAPIEEHVSPSNNNIIIENNEDISTLNLEPSQYQSLRPKVRDGWNIEKIQKQLKSESSSRVNSKEIEKFDNIDDLMSNIYYHGSISAHDNLKAGSTLKESERTGGYGAEYHSISLSKSKNIASNFASMGPNGTVMPVILKKDANIIEMPNIEDSIELEDILPQLWEQKVDAVKIGDWDIEKVGYGEQEIVILNPRAIMTLPEGTTYFQNYKKPKFQNMTKEEVITALNKRLDKSLNDPKITQEEKQLIKERYDKVLSETLEEIAPVENQSLSIEQAPDNFDNGGPMIRVSPEMEVNVPTETPTVKENLLVEEEKPVLKTESETEPINYDPLLEYMDKLEKRKQARQEAKQLTQLEDTSEQKQATKRQEAWLTWKSLVTNNKAVYDEIAKERNNQEIKYKADRLNTVYGETADITTAQLDNDYNPVGKSLNAIFENAENQGLGEAGQDFLFHLSNINRHKRGKGSAEYSQQQSQKFVDDFKREYPELAKQLQEDNRTWNKNRRQNLIDAGYINEKTSTLFEELDPDYVPFYFESEYNPVFQNVDEIKSSNIVKRATGGSKNVLPIKEAMMKQLTSDKFAIAKNDLFSEIIKSYKTRSPLGADIRQQVTDMSDSLYADTNGDKYLTAYINGERQSIKISDYVYNNIKTVESIEENLRNIEDKFSFVFKPLQGFSNYVRNIHTQWSPTFILTNSMKDIQDAPFNSKDPVKFAKNYPTSYTDVYNSKHLSEYATQFKELTGQDINSITSTENLSSEAKSLYDKYKNGSLWNKFVAGYGNVRLYGDINNSIEKNLTKTTQGKNTFFKMADKVSKANEFMELATRYAEFKTSIQNGASTSEAFYNAKDITTNFGRGGVLSKFINKNGGTFFNTSVQGFSKFVRNFSGENGAKGVVNSLAKATMLGVVPAILNHLFFDDDEDYEKLPDYIKDNYYLIKNDDGEFIRIPKGRMLSVFGSFARRSLEAVNGEENAFEGYLKNAISQSGPSNFLESNAFAPIIQATSGENGKAWYGGDIVPTRLQNVPKAEQSDESIDAISKWIGETFNISPYKVNYVIDQYTGGIGDFLLPLITEEANGDGSFLAPLKDKFTVNSTMDNKYVGEFYDTLKELEVKSNSKYATEEDELKSKYMSSVSYELSKLYSEKHEVQGNESLTKKEKYERVQEIQKQIDSIAENALNTYKTGIYEDNYTKIGDYQFVKKTDEDGETYWSKIYDDEAEDLAKLGMTSKELSTYFDLKQQFTELNNEYYDSKDSLEKTYGKNSEEYDAGVSELYLNKKNKIIDSIINTNFTDEQKSYIYGKYYSSDKAETITLAGISIDYFLDYEKNDFKADYNSNGKAISGSRKNKVINYINEYDLSIPEKAILIKSTNTFKFNDYNEEIVDYVSNLDIGYEDKVYILQELDMTLEDDGTVRWN